MSAPGSLAAVRAAVAAGAATFDDIARRTGVERELVPLAVDQLVRLGLLTADRLQRGCPDAGCGGCPSSPGGSGCAPGAGSAGIVALTLGPGPAR